MADSKLFLDHEFWEPSSLHSEPVVLFPFIATCLVVGASFDAGEGYHHNVSVETWGMAYDQGDNNNGMSFVSTGMQSISKNFQASP